MKLKTDEIKISKTGNVLFTGGGMPTAVSPIIAKVLADVIEDVRMIAAGLDEIIGRLDAPMGPGHGNHAKTKVRAKVAKKPAVKKR